MSIPNRLLINICCQDLAASKAFYTRLFAFEMLFDSEWFVNLKVNSFEIGLIDRNHEIVPEAARAAPTGGYLTFVVDSVERCHEVAQEAGFPVLAAPHDTFYGQRRLLLQDPDGLVIDVSAPMSA